MPSLFRSLSARFRRAPGGRRTDDAQQRHQSEQPRIDPRKQVQCKVLLLDGTDLNIVVAKSASGGDVYEQVFYTLDLEEKDYFGLQFTDHYHVQHWLDPAKKLAKQVPIGPPYTFRFRVKFYTQEPATNLKEELTRYQFFLQLKQDVLNGRIKCQRHDIIELAAYALQSELGDYNPSEHSALFVSQFRFHPEQDETIECEILERFKLCRGQSPAQAEINYLNRAKYLEMYGVDMHTVEGRDANNYTLGLTPQGMLVFDGNQKIGLFFWEKIQKLDFKNKKITLVVEEDADQAHNGQVQLHTFVFNLASAKACKHLWKCAIEHHTFFRLRSRRNERQSRSQFFRLGSTFKYRGQTEYETVHKDGGGGRLSRRASATFERKPSQRYEARQSLALARKQKRTEQRDMLLAGLNTSNQASNSSAATTSASGDLVSHLAVAESCQITPLSPPNLPNKTAAAEARLDNLLFSPIHPTSTPPMVPTSTITANVPSLPITSYPGMSSSQPPQSRIPLNDNKFSRPSSLASTPSHITTIPIGSEIRNSPSVEKNSPVTSPSKLQSRIPKYASVAPSQDSVCLSSPSADVTTSPVSQLPITVPIKVEAAAVVVEEPPPSPVVSPEPSLGAPVAEEPRVVLRSIPKPSRIPPPGSGPRTSAHVLPKVRPLPMDGLYGNMFQMSAQSRIPKMAGGPRGCGVGGGGFGCERFSDGASVTYTSGIKTTQSRMITDL